ncbi:uncharacterized protein LOC116613957 [Nematostella vectensis]|uniref:uncharacterized protein LOC116613957 n=1 Tax=Nematostella vectensis TaxID=45351 RepID=UPI0020776CE6|nr:uncharacterized protein LOC116613957 [Nematostella vectensis]
MKAVLILALLAVAYAYETDWEQLNQDRPVCFDARHRVYGSVRVPHEGFLHSVKLVHRTGKVACSRGHGDFWLIKEKRHWSNWGCSGFGLLLGYNMNVLVTNSHNHVLVPEKGQARFKPADLAKWYSLHGSNEHSHSIVLSRNLKHPYHLRAGAELRVWYGEALFKLLEIDNVGRVCVDVYAKFSY